MGFTALDYSSAISGADLVSAGIDTVFRYITDPAWPKSIQAPEAADLADHRIRIHMFDEGTADYMVNGSWSGYAGGVARARLCRARANLLGIDGTIFYSLDIDATADEIDRALEFLAGASSVDPTGTGAYGKYDFVRVAADSGYPIVGTEGWSHDQRDPRAVAWQLARQITVGGVLCDVLDLNPNPPTPPGGDDEMTPEDKQELAEMVATAVATYNDGSTVKINGKPYKANLFELAHGAHIATSGPDSPLEQTRGQVNELFDSAFHLGRFKTAVQETVQGAVDAGDITPATGDTLANLILTHPALATAPTEPAAAAEQPA